MHFKGWKKSSDEWLPPQNVKLPWQTWGGNVGGGGGSGGGSNHVNENSDDDATKDSAAADEEEEDDDRSNTNADGSVALNSSSSSVVGRSSATTSTTTAATAPASDLHFTSDEELDWDTFADDLELICRNSLSYNEADDFIGSAYHQVNNDKEEGEGGTRVVT